MRPRRPVGPFDGQTVAAVQAALEDEASGFARLGRPVNAAKVLRALLATWDPVAYDSGKAVDSRIGPPIGRARTTDPGVTKRPRPSSQSPATAGLSSSDEVYVVTASGRQPIVFGHEKDAEAYAATTHYGHLFRLKVLDHAEARTLIEGEG